MPLRQAADEILLDVNSVARADGKLELSALACVVRILH
jgi:hypothetical protein